MQQAPIYSPQPVWLFPLASAAVPWKSSPNVADGIAHATPLHVSQLTPRQVVHALIPEQHDETIRWRAVIPVPSVSDHQQHEQPSSHGRSRSARACRRLYTLLLRARAGGGAWSARASDRSAIGSRDSRSDLDDRHDHATPRLHDLRHAVRHRRERASVATDGRYVQGERRQEVMDVHAAGRAAVSRWSSRHERRCHRVAPSMGPARHVGREADVVRGSMGGDQRGRRFG